jgi:predicted amidohydrolase YtcJ
MIEPYSNKDTYGMLTMTDEMRQSALELLGKGYYGHAHSIGDGTVRFALDLVEEAHEKYPGKVRRFHIAHNHLVDPDDLKRFAELNVVAEVSPPQWFPFSATPLVLDYLGQERFDRWLDISAMLDAGITVAYGSDWPAGTPTGNPFRGLESLATRAHPNGEFEGTWGEPITVAEMIHSATMGGAYAMNREDSIGSIEVGKHADFIILNSDLFKIDPSDISEVVVEKTIFEGKVVYKSK